MANAILKSRLNPDDFELEERVVQINRVSKVVKGGRRFNLSTLVVVGDGKGHVGIGMGKASEVPEAIRKGVEAAKKNMITVSLNEHTIPHEIRHSFKTATVMLLPASQGTGVIAGGGVRAVLEAAGVKDVLTKAIGSNNKVNVVKATFEALGLLRSVEQEARRRDLTPIELRRRMTRRKTVATIEDVATTEAAPTTETVATTEAAPAAPTPVAEGATDGAA